MAETALKQETYLPTRDDEMAGVYDFLKAHEEAAKLLDRGVEEREAVRRARYLIAQMRAAFTDAEVDGWEGLEGTFELPDPDDEHVTAAAVVAGAGAVVTHNLKDFPSSNLPPVCRRCTRSRTADDPHVNGRFMVVAIIRR